MNTTQIRKVSITPKQKIFLVLVTFSMIPLFFAAKGAFSALGQSARNGEKILKKISFKNEPIEFVSVESDGEPIHPDEKFMRDRDWLEHLTIGFKNVSDKPIIYVSIALVFPETGSTEPQIVHFLKYGVNPLSKMAPNSTVVRHNPEEKSELLLPNGSAQVSLTAKDFVHLKEALAKRQPLSDLTQAEFQIMVVYFEDGTQWSAGTIARPDPDRPGKFIPIQKDKQEEK